MRLFNHQWSKKSNTIEWNHQSTILSNQSIKIRIWFINCKINCSSVRFYSTSRIISLIVFLSICSTYFFDNCTNQKHLLFTRQFFNDCTSILFITIREKFWNTRVCKSNRRVFFVFVRKDFSIRINRHFFIYLLDNFFSNCTSIIFITIRDIWRKYTRLHVKSTRFFLFRSRDFDFASSSWKFLFSRFLQIVRFRFSFRWNRRSHTKND